MDNILSKNKTILILFLEGFVSVSFQMLLMRQLTPFIGSSMIVASLIIGFYLASLSLGYAVGGRVKKDHLRALSKNNIISALIIGIGISYPIMNLFFMFTSQYIDNSLIVASLYLLIFLVPVVFLLGQTIPLLTNFYKKNQKVSEITGDLLAFNTVGSVFGSVVTALVLFNYFGMAKTIMIDILLMGIILFVIVAKEKRLKYLFTFLFIVCAGFQVNILYEKENFKLTNAYNNYSVKNNEDGSRYFIMNKSYSSAIFENGTNWKYIELIKNILFDENQKNLKNKEILILGAGGFTLSSDETIPENNYTYVDIDPDIKKIAEKYFLKKKIKGKFVAEDARIFVKKSKKKYDAVLVDLYSNGSTIPWHLLTKEFMKEVKATTIEDGVVIFNIISSGLFDDNYSKNIHNTINSTFSYCHGFPFNYNNDNTNIVYTCRNVKDQEKTVYVDDLSKSPLEGS